LTFGAASNGSGFFRTGGINLDPSLEVRHTQNPCGLGFPRPHHPLRFVTLNWAGDFHCHESFGRKSRANNRILLLWRRLNEQEDARANIARIAAVPIRQSALDKARAEAKAKKLRDEKEAASALEDFVKEFDADVAEEREWRRGGFEGGMVHSSAAGAGGRVNMIAGRRHFTTAPKVNLSPHLLPFVTLLLFCLSVLGYMVRCSWPGCIAFMADLV
jgi:hypothetical protein